MVEKLKVPLWLRRGALEGLNLKTGKFSGLKSHAYHIIMERLLRVMFRGFVNNDVWEALAELSYFL
jgi:hypothetical protein